MNNYDEFQGTVWFSFDEHLDEYFKKNKIIDEEKLSLLSLSISSRMVKRDLSEPVVDFIFDHMKEVMKYLKKLDLED